MWSCAVLRQKRKCRLAAPRQRRRVGFLPDPHSLVLFCFVCLFSLLAQFYGQTRDQKVEGRPLDTPSTYVPVFCIPYLRTIIMNTTSSFMILQLYMYAGPHRHLSCRVRTRTAPPPCGCHDSARFRRQSPEGRRWENPVKRKVFNADEPYRPTRKERVRKNPREVSARFISIALAPRPE